MDKARASVIGVIAAAVLLSGLLWLVPVSAGKSVAEGEDRPRREMTNEEANDQVKALMDALEAGINLGNTDLALVGFATDDAEWLGQQRQLVTDIIERLQGHGARLQYRLGWNGTMVGSREVAALRVYGGPTAVVDTVSGEIVGDIRRYAMAPDGRFLLHPFPQDDGKPQMEYEANLAELYAEVGFGDKAQEMWQAVIAAYPDASPREVARVHWKMAGAYADAGDATKAYAEYGNALQKLESEDSSPSYTSMQFDGKWERVTQPDQLRLLLAETAGEMGDEAKARSWYEALSESETEGLADLGKERLKEL